MTKARLLFILSIALSGCAFLGIHHLDKLYGPSAVVVRQVASIPEGTTDYWQDVKPLLDSRCVVCHGCYDAPCQLKLSAIEGITRGANKTPMYNNARLFPAEMTRLFEDAETTQEWREKDFFPVLNEREQSPRANREAGVLYQMLALKQLHPLPAEPLLNNDFTLALNRENSCPKDTEFEEYAKKHPLWGMPYALPALAPKEQATLLNWLEQGATYTPRPALNSQLQDLVAHWETFFNQDGLKAQLTSRYLFEHLFLAHIYFDELDETTYFRLVRSSSPPGEALQRISTRRPYDDPQTDRVYYRLIPERETIVDKTHMPYALNEERQQRWQKWFFNDGYKVTRNPGYAPKVAGNPFAAFDQIPADSRYRFLLDEAHYTIQNFINGPVCRGQVALNVIRDQFWIFFLNPNSEEEKVLTEFLAKYENELVMPSAEGNIYAPITTWLEYSRKQRKYLSDRDAYLSQRLTSKDHFGLDLIWQGDGDNINTALTVFRHFDSASVEQGLLGKPPKTAWVIGYPLLERIHYLLTAGYDIYGNVGHQLFSRLHMDFLRMEGEANFLMLLPQTSRDKERHYWYRQAKPEVFEYLTSPSLEKAIEPDIEYTSDDPKAELFEKLQNVLKDSVNSDKKLSAVKDEHLQAAMQKLMSFSGKATSLLSEATFIAITDNTGESSYFTLMRNNAHLNMTALLSEKKTLIPEENTVTVVNGLVGSYPNTFMRVSSTKVEAFVDQILALQTEGDYQKLMDVYGVRRTAKDFWEFTDQLHQWQQQKHPIEFGLFDFNRLENR